MLRPRSRTAQLLLLAACAACVSCGGGGDSSPPAGRGTPGARPATRIGACWPSPTIGEQGVGTVRVGGTVAALARTCAARDTAFTLGEGLMETGKVVRFEGHEVVALTGGGPAGTITRVIIADPAFRTAAGVGVGRTLGDLRRAYGGRLCAALGEGVVAVWAPELSGVSFAVGVDFPAAARRDLASDPSSLPDSARLTRAWIHGTAVDCGSRVTPATAPGRSR